MTSRRHKHTFRMCLNQQAIWTRFNNASKIVVFLDTSAKHVHVVDISTATGASLISRKKRSPNTDTRADLEVVTNCDHLKQDIRPLLIPPPETKRCEIGFHTKPGEDSVARAEENASAAQRNTLVASEKRKRMVKI